MTDRYNNFINPISNYSYTFSIDLFFSRFQCIVISGESGSGKTQSANYLVQQLTLLGRVRCKTWALISF